MSRYESFPGFATAVTMMILSIAGTVGDNVGCEDGLVGNAVGIAVGSIVGCIVLGHVTLKGSP